MIKIKIESQENRDETRYSAGTVAYILGETSSAVGTYFSNRGISVKGG